MYCMRTERISPRHSFHCCFPLYKNYFLKKSRASLLYVFFSAKIGLKTKFSKSSNEKQVSYLERPNSDCLLNSETKLFHF